jgi:2-polyprenyl-3-methyl-5-hydroxy-6-metoxy-1,4-benzoquinol methylase
VTGPRRRPSTRSGRPEPFERRDHYSYTAYADAATARSFDDLRFGGPIGDLIAGTQARVLANMIGRMQERVILDVGTGTGRAALMLARGGAQVTAVDASEQMLAIARRRAEEQRVSVRFLTGDAHALDFKDCAFDVAVSLRVLMHAAEWDRCLSELCRVADRLVIFDYPSARSGALLDAMARRVVNAVGGRTEAYRVFTDGVIARALDRSGFRVRSVHRQFVLPIRFHKAIGSRRFTEFSEDVLDRVGLLRLFGSPVTLCAERCVSS